MEITIFFILRYRNGLGAAIQQWNLYSDEFVLCYWKFFHSNTWPRWQNSHVRGTISIRGSHSDPCLSLITIAIIRCPAASNKKRFTEISDNNNYFEWNIFHLKLKTIDRLIIKHDSLIAWFYLSLYRAYRTFDWAKIVFCCKSRSHQPLLPSSLQPSASSLSVWQRYIHYTHNMFAW